MRKPQVLKGFRDYLPDDMRVRQQVIGRFRHVFESHGFEPLDTPALEYLEVLTGKAGENEKLMYAFEDQGGRRVGLRYDLTVPLARVVAMHQDKIVLPFKRYHIAPVWRAEKPQRGRFREFWQCDADIAGTASMIADAEIIAMLGESLSAIGLPRFTMQISHRVILERMAAWAGIPDEHASQVYRSVDKLAKIGRDAVALEMAGTGIERSAADRILELMDELSASNSGLDLLAMRLSADPGAVEAIDQLRQIFSLLPTMGIIEGQAVFEPTLARGLDYYTGPVFEAVVEEPRIGSVAGGGRYEHLIGTFANRTVPATGVSLGLERILEVISEFGLLADEAGSADAFVVTFDEQLDDSARAAASLRKAGLRVELASQLRRGIGDQLKYASRKGIGFAVIPESGAQDSRNFSVKNLTTGEQRMMSIEEAATLIGGADQSEPKIRQVH